MRFMIQNSSYTSSFCKITMTISIHKCSYALKNGSNHLCLLNHKNITLFTCIMREFWRHLPTNWLLYGSLNILNFFFLWHDSNMTFYSSIIILLKYMILIQFLFIYCFRKCIIRTVWNIRKCCQVLTIFLKILEFLAL